MYHTKNAYRKAAFIYNQVVLTSVVHRSEFRLRSSALEVRESKWANPQMSVLMNITSTHSIQMIIIECRYQSNHTFQSVKCICNIRNAKQIMNTWNKRQISRRKKKHTNTANQRRNGFKSSRKTSMGTLIIAFCQPYVCLPLFFSHSMIPYCLR